MPSLAYPLINGFRYDFSSIKFNFLGFQYVGIKAINYKSSKKPGDVRGTHAQLLGRTRGQYSAEASFEMFREEWDTFIKLLKATSPGIGFMEAAFDINVGYSEALTAPMQQDDLIGCVISEVDTSNSQGGDALTVKASLHVLIIKHNGQLPLTAPLG